MEWTQADLDDLARAKQLLESPSFAVRMTALVGTPIEKGLELLPAAFADKVQSATQSALSASLRVAVGTLREPGSRDLGELGHRLAAAAAGAAGGAFGLAALALELPLSTTLMLRSIADIGRAHGEELQRLECQLACLEVFALGGRATTDDAGESGYFAVRAALARSVSQAASFIAKHGLAEEGAPALVHLVKMIASRFGVVVGQKAAAVAVPVIGAVSGAAVNALFMSHFQDMAHGHFTVRRLERKYGAEDVRRRYQ